MRSYAAVPTAPGWRMLEPMSADSNKTAARSAFAEARANEALRAREAWNRRPAMLKHAHRAPMA